MRVVQKTNIVGMGALGQAVRPFVPSDLPVVLFCVKAFDLESAMIEHDQLWPKDVPFVTLSNGYLEEIITRVQPTLGQRPIRLGMTTLAARFDRDGVLHTYTEQAKTIWGPVESLTNLKPTPAEEQLFQKNPSWSWADPVRPLVKRKWIYNATLNTLCGALRLGNNGQLLNHRALANDVLEEAVALSHELWPQVQLSEDLDRLQDGLWKLVEQTKNNENSMMKDVRAGRRNESAFLAGLAVGRRGFDRLKTYHTILARFDRP